MFERGANSFNLLLMAKQYQFEINDFNIATFTRRKANIILKEERDETIENFLFYLVAKWVRKVGINTLAKLSELRAIIRRLKLKLEDEDVHDIDLLEERIFSKERHIKILEVDAKLRGRENVGVKFVDAQLYKKTLKLKFMYKADLLISNHQILLHNRAKNEILLFPWEKITRYSYEYHGFEFGFGNQTFVLRIHDQITLNNTMENFIGKKVKHAIRKRKDN